MPLDPDAPVQLVIPELPSARRRWLRLGVVIGVAGLVAAVGVGLGRAGYRPDQMWTKSAPELELISVDRGDLDVNVTEFGSLESSNNATARSKVEALIGQVGGAAGQAGQGKAAGGGQGGQRGQQPGQQAQQAPVAKKAQGPKGRPGARKPSAAAAKSAAKDGVPATPAAGSPGGAAAPAAAASGGGGGGGGMSGGAAGAAGGAAGAVTTNPNPKPVIRSFAYQVLPHQPLRPKAPAAQPVAKPAVDPAQMAGGGGGRRGGGGQNALATEKPGATRIISILPEGTRVEAGDVVCELDSSAFQDEVLAQKIRYLQAQAWVLQAQALLEVNEISLREYRDGINPQDVQLIRQYIATCTTERERVARNLEWALATNLKGMRSAAQLKADRLAVQQADTALLEAKGMAYRLEHFTGPKLLKALEAKSAAIRADKLAQESAFQIESDRLKRLERMVENCTMRASRDGLVVYYTQANFMGRVDNQVQEGMTVREGQPIFNLPDPKHMQVKARINETKVALIKAGQRVHVRIDAFPDRPLTGVVTEITALSAPANQGSDVRIYYATVKIEGGGFDELRPGLSAEVDIHIDTRIDVTRVPLRALREFQGQPYVAIAERTTDKGPSWRWTPVALGMSDENFAEVVSGLQPGDQVIARPQTLPAPVAASKPAPVVATANLDRRD